MLSNHEVSRYLLHKDPLRSLNQLRAVPPALATITRTPLSAAIVTDPALIRDVLMDNVGHFQKSPRTLLLRYALGDGTATSYLPPDGARYYAPFTGFEELRSYKRRVIAPAFSSMLMTSYAESIQDLTTETLERWQPGTVREVYTDMSNLMLRILLRCLFNRDTELPCQDASRTVHSSAQAVYRRLHSFFPPANQAIDLGFPPRPSMNHWLQGHDNRLLRARDKCLRTMATRLVQSPPCDPYRQDDLLSLLEAARSVESGPGLSDMQLLNAVIGLFLAGYENSAASAAWTLWLLANHPELQNRAAAEVEAAFTSNEPLFDRVYQFPFLKACLDESLRLYPPVWSMAREAMKATRIGPYQLRAHSILILSPWLQHHRPAAWPEPDTFCPDRFLQGDKPWVGNYFPFGAGPRSCPGEAFARLELTIVLANILRTWRLHPTPGYLPPEPLLSTTQRPMNGMYLTISPRHR